MPLSVEVSCTNLTIILRTFQKFPSSQHAGSWSKKDCSRSNQVKFDIPSCILRLVRMQSILAVIKLKLSVVASIEYACWPFA